MPNLSVVPSPEGPLVEVWLGPNSDYQEAGAQLGIEMPKPVYVLLLVGTGSPRTVIDYAEVARLAGIFPSSGDPDASHQEDREELGIFDLSLCVHASHSQDEWRIGRLSVKAANWPKGGRCVGILGRDALNRSELRGFVYRGLHEPFTLSWE